MSKSPPELIRIGSSERHAQKEEKAASFSKKEMAK